MIIAGFSGVGKTELAKKYSNVIDLDSAPYVYDDSDMLDIPFEERKGKNRTLNKEWPLNYIKDIKEAVNKYDYVLVWDREDIIKEYKLNNLDFVLCYPDKSDLVYYEQRYRKRGNTEEYIKWKLKQYEEKLEFYNSLPNKKIILKDNEYLEDYFIKKDFKLIKKENTMIVIYDFDGTLTPYPLPKYEIFKKCGIDEIEGAMRGKLIMEEENLSLYEAYIEAYRRYLKENNIPFNRESVCLGADKVELNDGVLEYFKDLCFSKTGIKHYVVTSGFEEYIKDTKINTYLDGVYGTTFTLKNNVYDTLEILMNEEYKVEAIKNIVEINNVDIKDVIYFGDGLTDKDAFKYVHDNGGKSVFVSKNKANDKSIKILKGQGIIDYCFELKYGRNSEIYNFIKNYK